ncbi:radical SAM protein [archaeon]|nr:radical SAM protein [archaeon]TET24556.1 MAG: radical SAM protein [Candidatus Bathyarchaeum sp.]
MRPRVTLVNPPYPINPHQHMPFPQLGLGYLAAVLEENQYEVDVIDCQALYINYDEFKREISKRQPDIVGLTSITLTYKSALHLAKIVKELHPNCLTVLGGPHATFWDEEALQECPHLDVVVRKEGEYTLLELVQRLEAGKSFHDVQGITCRKDGKIVVNPDRPYIENLDELPYPARHLWPLESLRKVEDVFYLTTSRGCTSWCEFCEAVRMFGRRFRMRSPKNVVDEIEYLYKTYDATQFTFCDDAFTVDKSRIEELCAEILKRNLKIIWNCGTRVDMVTKELLIKMKEAGCVSVWFGVESGSQEVLDEMQKGISTDQTVRTVGLVRELGLQPVPNVLLGFPGETKETAWKTIKFVEKLCPDTIAFFNIATPLPGTPLYDRVKENGWLRITDFNLYDCNTPIFETPTLSMKELEELYEKAFQRFYLRPTYILRMWAKGWTYGLSATRNAFRYLLRAIKFTLRNL